MSGNHYSTDPNHSNGCSSSIETLVARLESEFHSTLGQVLTLKAFTEKANQLLRLMNFGHFCFTQGVVTNCYHRKQPVTLISTLSQKEIKRSVHYLFDAVSGQVNRDVSTISYEETDSLVDSQQSGVKRGCYILDTRSGNYAYFVRKGVQRQGFRQVLCIVQGGSANQFKQRVERNLLGLDLLNRVVEEIGHKKFPGIFKAGKNENKIDLDSKPIRLLNLIALDDLPVSQAAGMLNISVDTANKHIARVKSDLGVSTLPSAVFYAVSKGLIDNPS